MTVTAPAGNVMLKTDKASIDSLSTTTIAGLPALGVTSIVSTNGPVDISVAQALALEGARSQDQGSERGPRYCHGIGHRGELGGLNGEPDRWPDGDRRHRACVDQCGCQLHVSPDRGDPQERRQRVRLRLLYRHRTRDELEKRDLRLRPRVRADTLIGFLETGAGHDLLQFSNSMFGFSSGSSQTRMRMSF